MTVNAPKSKSHPTSQLYVWYLLNTCISIALLLAMLTNQLHLNFLIRPSISAVKKLRSWGYRQRVIRGTMLSLGFWLLMEGMNALGKGDIEMMSVWGGYDYHPRYY
mmetsp:Transcript_29872/g.72178  ORF Transcript_29872/g.72178 Transcript_29872/m.72178 type:complete len:106 (-) Transcript_29872:125-442(-)